MSEFAVPEGVIAKFECTQSMVSWWDAHMRRRPLEEVALDVFLFENSMAVGARATLHQNFDVDTVCVLPRGQSLYTLLEHRTSKH